MKKSIALTLIIISFVFFTGQASAASGDFSLYWSANSFVPFEYEGKAMPTQGSTIKIVVAPAQTTPVSSDSLYYVWLLDDEPASYANGTGNSSFSFVATKRSGSIHTVECQIYDQKQGSLVWENNIDIKIRKPEILVRQPEELYSNQTIYTSPEEELKLEATPLFFNIQSIASLNFSWKVNSKESTSSQTEPNKVTLKIPQTGISEPLVQKVTAASWLKNNEIVIAYSSFSLSIK